MILTNTQIVEKVQNDILSVFPTIETYMDSPLLNGFYLNDDELEINLNTPIGNTLKITLTSSQFETLTGFTWAEFKDIADEME